MDTKFFNPVAISKVIVEPELLSKIDQVSLELLSEPPNNYAGSDLTLRGGAQRRVWPPSRNVSWLKDWIEAVARQYQEDVCKQADSYDALELTPKLANAWTITQPQHSYQVTHNHPFGNISGNLYLEVPELDSNSSLTDGCISFLFDHSQDLKQLRLRNSLHYKPVVGTMLVFPSWLPHQVYPWSGTGNRRVLAWDCQLLPQ